MADVEVTFQGVSIPANTSGTVYVYEDVDDDGGPNSVTVGDTTIDYDNVASTSLSDGQTSYTLSGFDGSGGNMRWPRVELDNTDDVSAAELTEAATVNDVSTTVTAAVSGPATGGAVTPDAGATGSGTATATVSGPATATAATPDAGGTGSGTATVSVGSAASGRAVTPDAGATGSGTATATVGAVATASAITPDAGATGSGTATATVGSAAVATAITPDAGATTATVAQVSAPATASAVTPDIGAETFIFATTEAGVPSGLTLDASVEDEITATWDDFADYKDYRIQLKESSSGSWAQTETTVDEATTSYTFTGLEDGEEFDVRIRHETEHVTGAWSATATATTILPAPGSLTATVQSQTQVDLSWTDTADNEDGIRIYREEKFGSSFGPKQEIADLAPNTTAYSDTSALPGTEYRYTVEHYTEHSTADTTTTATTTAATVPTTDVNAMGWTIEVQHPDGQWLDVQLIGEPTRRPTLNGLPRIEAPVPKNEHWESSTWDRQPLRVWFNGRRQPIDRLADVEMQPGQTTLIGVGGVELRERVERMVQDRESHALAEDLVTSNTSYAANVDTPNADSDDDVPIQTASTTSTFDDIDKSGTGATDPAAVQGGGVDLLQSLFFFEGEDFDAGTSNGTSVFSDTKYSNSEAHRIDDSTSSPGWTFTSDYDIPSGNVEFQFRIQIPNAEHHGFTFSVDGQELYSVDRNTLTGGESEPDWSIAFADIGGLAAGDHTVTFEITDFISGGDADVYIDCLALYDDRFSYTFDDSVTSPGLLDGPQLYPDAHTVTFETVVPGRQLLDGTIDVSMNDTSGTQRLGLSFDGNAYTYASNTESYNESAPSGATSLAWEVRLSRYGSQNETPTTGHLGQSVSDATLSATLDNTPIVLNRILDARLVDVLNDIASDGDFIWQYTLADDGTPTVQWTQPGQRTRDEAIPLSDYTTTKDMSVVKKAIVYGTSQPAEDTVTANHGTAVSLTNDYLQETSEKVIDPSSGTRYERGVDYEFDELNGEITTLSSGSITDGQSIRVEYERKTRGVYEAPTFSGDPESVEVATVPGVTTDQAAQQVAITLVSQLSTPRWTASVDVHTSPDEWTLVDALSLDGVPVDGRQLEIYSVEDTPRGASLQLGSRDTVEETIGRIRSQLEGVSRKI